MFLHDNSQMEYRSRHSLTLGHDIKLIAIDANDHRLEIMKYFSIHKIDRVQVCLIDDLKKSERTHEKPTSPYHHKGGVPTLKWLCAQKGQSTHSFFKTMTNEKESKSDNIFSEKNVSEVMMLVGDAEKYQAINFQK